MTRLSLLAICLASTAAFAQEDAGVAPVAAVPDAGTGSSSQLNIAVLKLKGSPSSEGQTEPVSALLAARLADEKALKVITDTDIAQLIGVQRQKELMGAECKEGSACFTELAGAIGSEYLVSGRLDRFGDKWTLTTTTFDAQKNTPVGRARVDADSEAELPAAAERAAISIIDSVRTHSKSTLFAAPVPAPSAAAEEGTGADIGIRIGTNFVEGLSSLSPSGDLVLGYRFDPAWVGFLQVGITVVSQGGSGVNILPSVLGARHLYRVDKSVQPYWGLGLGVQLSIGSYGIFEQTGPLPSVVGLLGVTWFVTKWFGVGLEGSTNLAQTVLGLSRNNVGNGFNLKPSVSFTFRP